jgi:hypothetical protein
MVSTVVLPIPERPVFVQTQWFVVPRFEGVGNEHARGCGTGGWTGRSTSGWCDHQRVALRVVTNAIPCATRTADCSGGLSGANTNTEVGN